MQIKEVQIRNYKNFLKSRFVFNKGINVIIGENDCGKTNFIRAIRLILDSRLSWQEKELSQELFSRKMNSWQEEVIIISIIFSDLSPDNEAEILLKTQIGNSENEGRITLFILPKKRIRKDLENLHGQNRKDKLLTLTINDYETIFTFGANTDFLDDRTYSNFKDTFGENLDESYIGSISAAKEGIEEVRKSLIDFTYIDALRDTVRELRQKSNPLITLLKQIEPKILDTDRSVIKRQISDINTTIDNIEQVSNLAIEINKKIVSSVGNTYAANIRINSNLPYDVKDLIRNLELKSFGQNPYDLNDEGLGTNNIIYISLKLLEYSYIKKIEELQSKFFLLLIEEPEAHLHKHIQMSLFEKLEMNDEYNNIQILMTTHSDNISAACKISAMNIVQKLDEHSLVMQPSAGLDSTSIMNLERYLDSKRTPLLFSKGVILVEGDGEELLLPTMFKKCYGLSLDELGISLINIGSVGFNNIYSLFSEDRIKKNCAVITDLDTSLDGIKNDAEELGATRKAKIDLESASNEYIKGFYANYTLEVDFGLENKGHLIKHIKNCYKQTASINNLEERIKSDSIKTSGEAILQVAKHNKKGWNSILIGNILDFDVIIPQYIIGAFAFSSKKTLLQQNNLISLIAYYKKQKKDDSIISLKESIDNIINTDSESNLARLLRCLM